MSDKRGNTVSDSERGGGSRTLRGTTGNKKVVNNSGLFLWLCFICRAVGRGAHYIRGNTWRSGAFSE